MRGLDETDEAIIEQLLEDSRKPYSEIASTVGLSPPAVSDRVDRLVEIGLIRRFTVDLDRGLLREGESVLVTIQGTPGSGERLRDQLRAQSAVEHVFQTVDDTVVCTLIAAGDEIGTVLSSAVSMENVSSYEVQLLAESAWNPALDGAELAPECVECGNTVTPEGERERIDGTLYHFCCDSCLASFRDRYEKLEEGT